MLQYGIKAVVATSFGEIFYSNAINNLLLPAIVSDEVAEKLMAYAQSGAKSLTIDIEAKTITTDEGVYPFTLQARHQQMFLDGTDLIGSTLKDRALIEAFIERRREEAPWAVDLPAKRKMSK
jgi:3-isopropylmalate/(R)-2-methylmalate dehydratase small subunit